ncbi:MAG: septum formation initiator family protein [Clostridia bacterium]|nr:septum formation initiator family protein [Clostridia bacterium]
MTYHRTSEQNGNQLAEKLRREYRNRGASLHGISATSTEELMTRAQMGRNPKVNVSEQAFAESVGKRASGYTGNRSQGYTQRPRTSRYQQTGAGRKTAGTAARKQRSVREDKTTRNAEMFSNTVPERQEILVEKKRFPLTFLLLLSFVTVMIMMIILSIAQIYQTTDDISSLEYELGKLQATAAELELRIEEKNDIRVIEQIATDRLGMVKEDSVQKKYISLSDGERIELVEDTSDENAESGFGSMLSSIWTAFGDFFAGSH